MRNIFVQNRFPVRETRNEQLSRMSNKPSESCHWFSHFWYHSNKNDGVLPGQIGWKRGKKKFYIKIRVSGGVWISRLGSSAFHYINEMKLNQVLLISTVSILIRYAHLIDNAYQSRIGDGIFCQIDDDWLYLWIDSGAGRAFLRFCSGTIKENLPK